MMIGTNYPSNSYLPENNGNDILKNVSPIIREADIAFGNLEGTILSEGGEIKKCGDPKKCYAFKSPDEYVKHYKNAGFNILSLANNHINDFGKIGRLNTQRVLEENNIYFSGTIEKPYSIFIKDNIKYGFASFSPNKGTIQINKLTTKLNYEISSNPGHKEFFSNLKHAAYTETKDVLFVNRGVDLSRPLSAQNDCFWWGYQNFSQINKPYFSFKRIVRGYQSNHLNDIENSKTKVLCTLFKQPLTNKKILAGIFSKNGDIVELFESK